jgi:release factor glutamine methyltransferase
MTVLEVIQRSTEFLRGKGVENPRLQIELMLAHVLAMPRLKLYLNFDRALTDAELTQLRDMTRRRAAREPLQYILGSTSFCGLEIKCAPAALIPRPETEILAERAWKFLSTLNPPPSTTLDLGTGTGCLAIAIAANAPQTGVVTVDVSPDALALALENVAAHQLGDRVELRHGDTFDALREDETFDLIVSNPPYIPDAEVAELQPEVRDFEPRLALAGGMDGLDFFRRIAATAPRFLKPHGALMVEFSDGQETALKNLFEGEKWIVAEIVEDYSPRPRILIARRQ